MVAPEQSMKRPTEHPSFWKRIRAGLSTIFESRIAVVGLLIVLFWVFVAVAAPLLTPYSPTEQDWQAPNSAPSITHPLGTDSRG